MMRSALALMLWLLASPAVADDAAEANRLMVEAVRLVDAVEKEPAAEAKFQLLKKAHDNLTAIIERFPSTDLAVKLATGQRIGRISLAKVRKSLDEARAILSPPVRPGAPVRVWRHRSGVGTVAFFRGGRRALTAGVDGTATVRNVRTGEILRTWRHGSAVTAAALSRDRRWMLTAGADRSAALRNARTGKLLDKWWNRGALDAVALSPNGRRALAGQWNAVHLIEIKDRKVLRTWRHRAPVTAVAYSPDGRRVFMGFADGRARLGDVRTGATLHRWKHKGAAGGGVTTATFSMDGKRVLVGAASGMAVLRDIQTGQTLRKWDLGYGHRVRSVTFSPNKPWVMTGDDSHEVELHDVETGKTLRKWKYGAAPLGLSFSPDSRRVLIGFGDGAAIVCDLVLPGRGDRMRTVLTPEGGCW